MPKTHIVSFSELDTLRMCAHKHELAYKQRWQPPTTSPALSRGITWHLLMEEHYNLLRRMQQSSKGVNQTEFAERMHAYQMQLLGLPERREPGGTEELLAWMYDGYLDHYGLDDGYKILAVEHAPEVWLPTPNGGRSNFKLKLKIDLIVKWQGKIWILDHKTCRDLPRDKELDIDDQFGLYTWAMRKLGKDIFGSIHSAARTQRNKSKPQLLEDRFHRSMLHRTDKELERIAVEAQQIFSAGYRWKDGAAPRSPDPDRCGWRCSFTEACLMGRKGANEQRVLIDMQYTQNFTRH